MISIARSLLSSGEEGAIHRVLASGQLAEGEIEGDIFHGVKNNQSGLAYAGE
jgi:hypothetical protein